MRGAGKTLARLRASLAPPPPKGGKARAAAAAEAVSASSPQPAPPEVALLDGAGAPLPEATPNGVAWAPPHVLSLGAQRLPLVRNAPLVEALSLYGAPRVGLPLVPTPAVAFCGEDALFWSWSREGAVPDSNVLSTQRRYVPTAADAGATLRVRCAPPSASDASVPDWSRGASCAASAAVEPAPSRPAATARAAALAPRAAGAARVLTYNALADAFAHTWGALYPYLNPSDASPERRLPLALADVLAADADVACLQEVDARLFDRFWAPQMAAAGYIGVHTPKAGPSAEGPALFVRASAYRIAAARDVDLRMALAGDGAADNEEEEDEAETENERGATMVPAGAAETQLPPPPPGLGPLLTWQPALATAMRRVTTVAQLALLLPVAAGGTEAPPLPPLLVANTHLFFHPRAGHVRVLQAHALLRAAAAFASEHATSSSDAEAPALVLCGDLNAEPHDGAVRYLATGALGGGDAEWAQAAPFSWGGASSRAAARDALAEAEAALAGGDVASAERAAAEAMAAAASARAADARSRLDAWHGGRAAAAAAGLLRGTAGARNCALRGAAAEAAAVSGGGEAPPPANAYAALRSHLRAGCTFKSCPHVAAWHLRRVAGLSPALALPAGGSARTAALSALDALALAVEADAADAGARQAAMAAADASLQPAALPRDPLGFAAAPLGLGAALAHPYDLRSGCGEPPWTNFVGGFAATLDYVLFDARRLEATQAMPPPPLDAVAKHTALPSAEFPSDHLPQCCDLRRKSA